MIENKAGFRVCVDPFNDSPEWALGPRFPKEFKGQPFGANIVLSTEPDADHAYSPGDWLQHAPETKPNSNPFPGFDLRGTVIYEWNGDLNIAYSYTIDGIRLTHLADNAHVLTSEQIAEIGTPDILFISPSKPKMEGKEDVTTIENISLLKPKLVVWAHHIAPENLPDSEDPAILRAFFVDYFKTYASISKNYEGDRSFMELCYLLENAIVLNKKYDGVTLKEPSLEITDEFLASGKEKPKGVLFKRMLASQNKTYL